ncbi:spermidine synthase [Martelella endophytica]|uniref:Parallel beta-helix repeat-containing protein n=1 Tax=Martelella endophytica TaxID=1486262 RepID=A0A0D5LUK3_MAREN|nr:hypothetical protein [Martelella endophytica]AJY47660.1 parallel beta-helix repeat-containing protein [Martelella endophytica]
MIPWIELDRAEIPGETATLRLKQRGAEFSIMLGANELMNSRLSGSEEALAELAAEKLAGCAGPRVLIGGLGMGFTLRAALAVLPADARIVVAELVPAVVRWAKGPMADVFQGALDDPRMEISVGDVTQLIAQSKAGFDAILLDVDNGPDGLTRAANDRLYDLAGLARAREALSPKGVLAVWSSGPDDRFTARMKKSGFLTEVKTVRANAKRRGARHVIWLGCR